ncbi:MAG: Histidine--tRNA ligase [Candidatus Methanocomedens sp.]|nr:MAG: Histidine--tRNA ligase [ANME-2 cluster archaeon]
MKIQKPRGTRDFLPEENLKRRFIETKLRQTAKRWGYNEIKTPTFEQIELFTVKSGEGILGEIYNFKDKGDREMALRPELTAPVVRMYVNELQRAPKPVKLYYFDNCFRYERPQKGRFREFWQFGAELIGSPRPEAEAEVIALACRMLEDAGADGELNVGHLGVIRTLFTGLDAATQGQIMRLVDKKDDKGLEDYLEEIDADIQMREKLFELIGLTGSDAVDEAKRLLGNIEELETFQAILDLLDIHGLDYTVNFGIARGLDYYTGMVFEIYSSGLGAQNQVCGGGSYRLAHLFGGKDIESTGFALGFDRVMEVCTAQPPEESRVVVVCFDETRKEGMRIAQTLREHMIVDVDVMGRSFGAQLKFANNVNAKWAVIIGEDEVAQGKVALKDMESGEQEILDPDELVKRLTS